MTTVLSPRSITVAAKFEELLARPLAERLSALGCVTEDVEGVADPVEESVLLCVRPDDHRELSW